MRLIPIATAATILAAALGAGTAYAQDAEAAALEAAGFDPEILAARESGDTELFAALCEAAGLPDIEICSQAIDAALGLAPSEEMAVEEPMAEEPVTEEPVAEEPMAEEPMAEEPMAEEPMAEEPMAEEPVAEEPAMAEEQPVVEEQPMAEEAPVSEEPQMAEEQPVTTEEPMAEEEPAMAEEPVTQEPQMAQEEPVVVEEPMTDEELQAEAEAEVAPEDAQTLEQAGLPPELLIAMEELNRLRGELRESDSPQTRLQVVAARARVSALCAEAGFADLQQCQRAVAEALAESSEQQAETTPEPVEEIPQEALEQSEVEALPESVPEEEVAPVLDSQKESGTQPAQQQAQTPSAPPPSSDAEAQAEAVPEQIESATTEQGQRIDRNRFFDRQRPEGTRILDQFGINVVIQFNNQTFVQGNDEQRYVEPEDQVIYEELPGGRTREVVFRDDGSQLITIYARNGDVLRRSRITPDGREIVLVYVEDRYYDDVADWRDPGADLPPLRLDIPVREYVFDVGPRTRDEELVEFWNRPPVQSIDRLYSIDEVRRSSRIRDLARRVEVDDLNFAFGSAAIAQSEIRKLATVANAMLELLDRNPGDTFLVEGHADAPGTELVNLRISQQRADTVAQALTDYFGIPPENLVTQGYGERYLKVRTELAERLNRRVVFRRLGPLVSPMFADSGF